MEKVKKNRNPAAKKDSDLDVQMEMLADLIIDSFLLKRKVNRGQGVLYSNGAQTDLVGLDGRLGQIRKGLSSPDGRLSWEDEKESYPLPPVQRPQAVWEHEP